MMCYQAITLCKSMHGVYQPQVSNNFSEDDYYVSIQKKGRQFQIQTSSFRKNTYNLVEVGIGGGCGWCKVATGDLLHVISVFKAQPTVTG